MSTTSIALPESCIPGQMPTKAAALQYRLLTFGEQFQAALVGCKHNGAKFGWSWPQTLRADDALVYPRGYDSHQTCSGCGQQRFFNSKTWTPGPAFIRIDVAPKRVK